MNRKDGRGSNIKYLPWVFTEGLYMLMTILKGPLATRQSKALIRIFRAMKDYIAETQGLAAQRDLLCVAIQTTENTEAIRNIQSVLTEQRKLLLEHDDKLFDAYERFSDMVRRSELSPVLLNHEFDEQSEYLLLNGHPAKADETFIEIFVR